MSWNDGLTGARSPLLRFAGLIAYSVGFSIGVLSRLFGWFRQHKALGTGLGLVFAGGALGVFKYVKATGGLVNAVSVLPYYLRVAGAELKYLTMRMAAFNPAALPGMIKSAFTAMATSVRISVVAMGSSLARGLVSAWAFSAGMARSTVTWTVGFAKGIGFVLKQLGLFTFSLLKAAVQMGLFVVRMVAAQVAMIAQSVATGIVTAAQWALNLAMTANPIGLIIAGVGLLIAGIVVVYKNWDKVWAGMIAVVDWVWVGLKAGWKAVVKFFWQGVTWVSEMFSRLGTRLAEVFSTLWDGVKTAFIGIFNWLVGKLNLLLTIHRSLAGLIGIKIPMIPTIETGEQVIKPNQVRTSDSAMMHQQVVETESRMIKSEMSIIPEPVLAMPKPVPINTQTTIKPIMPVVETTKSAPTRNVVSNAITTDRSTRSLHIDRSIRDVRITVSAAGQDAKSLKEQLLEVFAELAAQGDGIEGIMVDA